jgi:hypothetical protein
MPTITRNPTPVDQAIASNSHENSPTSPPSQETAQNPTVPDQPHPSTPAPDQPTSPSAVAAQPSMLADQPTLVGPTPSTSEIWALHSRGLDAEGRQDWAQAIQCYQQIELAPKDQWPRDVEVRLANAQRQLNGK